MREAGEGGTANGDGKIRSEGKRTQAGGREKDSPQTWTSEGADGKLARIDHLCWIGQHACNMVRKTDNIRNDEPLFFPTATRSGENYKKTDEKNGGKCQTQIKS